MDVYIDNINLLDYGIKLLDWSGGFGIAKEREDNRTWFDKSGIDKNLENIRYEASEFTISCIVKKDTQLQCYQAVKALTDYMFQKGVFVLSMRDGDEHLASICERSLVLFPEPVIRTQNSLFLFKLGLRDVNPNALKFHGNIENGSFSIDYTKGQNAVLYWGDGTREKVSNSKTYTKSDYSSNGTVDVIIDIDKDADEISTLTCDFSSVQPTGILPETVTFTDLSTGSIVLWSWDFGDGNASTEQNPTHIYTEEGSYTVKLQVFNDAQGSASETKIAHVVVRKARLKIGSDNFFLINNEGNFLRKN